MAVVYLVDFYITPSGSRITGSFSVDYTNFVPNSVQPTIVSNNLTILNVGGNTSTMDSTNTSFTIVQFGSGAPNTFQAQFYDFAANETMYIGYIDPNLNGQSVTFAPPADAPTLYNAPGDNGSLTSSPAPTIACFALGTLISTPTGSIPVQDLQIGDLILNHLGQSVPVKWIGKQRFHPAFAGGSLPICIRQGAFGNNLPLRDLYVSPGHAMYIDNCLLIDAKAMINGATITQVTQWEGDVEYFHIETEHHEIILAEGTPAETFMDNVSRACFNNYAEYEVLYPEVHEMIELDIPRVSYQRQLPNTIKHKLEQIAQELIGEGGADKERMVG
jgi:hypothetical protein